MKSIHLTEDNLQAYLLKELQDDAIATHFSECSECRKSLEEYQFLIERMQQIDTEPFPFDVTTLAMDTIMLYEKQQSKKQDLVFWMLLILPLIVIASFSIPYISKILPVFYSKSILTTLLLIGTALLVLLFLWLDLAREYKTKADKLFKNNLQPIL